MSKYQTSELPEQLNQQDYQMQNCGHDEGCLTTIHVKNESFTVSDVIQAQKEFKLMSYIFTKDRHPKEIVKGPLSFVVGNVRVVVFKEDDSHTIQPCL